MGGIITRQLAPLPRRSVYNNAILSKSKSRLTQGQQVRTTTYIAQSRYIIHYGPSLERQYGYLDIEEIDIDEIPESENAEILVGEFEEAPLDYKPRTTFIPPYAVHTDLNVGQGPAFAGHAQRLAAEQGNNSSTAMKRSFSEQQTFDRQPLEHAYSRKKRSYSEEPQRRPEYDSLMDTEE